MFLPVSLFHLAFFIDDDFEIDFVKQTFISKSKSSEKRREQRKGRLAVGVSCLQIEMKVEILGLL